MEKRSIIFLSCLVLLTGCPAPNKYVLADSKRTYLSSTSINTDDFEVSFSSTYTWRVKNKRIINSGVHITNKTDKELKLAASDFLIVTPSDTLIIADFNTPMNEDFGNRGDTVTIAAKARQYVDLYFVSLKDYRKSAYGKKKRNEQIELQLQLFNKVDTSIRLRYEPTQVFFFQ